MLREANANRKVVIGYCHPEQVSGRFCDSLVGLLLYDASGPKNVVTPGGGTIALQSGPRIAEARSQIVDDFLTNPIHEGVDWLLMLDSDMVFAPDLVAQLLKHAHPTRVPILGGLCFAGSPGGSQYPTVYRAYNEDDGALAVEPVDDFPDGALVKVGATGAACLLVHRNVYREMSAKFGKQPDGRPNPYPWFAEGLTTAKGIPLGEDIAFCRKAMLLGIPIHVHTGIVVGHRKTATLDLDSFRAYQAREQVTA